jgi:hypothetical protein
LPDEPSNTADRRKALAESILLPDFKQSEFAKQWGVSDSQISLDKKSKEFLSVRNGKLIDVSIRGIYHAAMNGDVKAQMFVVERTCALMPEDGESMGSNAATTLLASILSPGDAALRAENERLKTRLAAIEDRLGKLNGLGKEVLNDTTDCESK